MAKKKTEGAPGPAKPKGRPKSPDAKGRAPIVMTIRAREAWEAWVDKAADRLARDSGLRIKLDRTQVVDEALSRLAKGLGIDPPPSRF